MTKLNEITATEAARRIAAREITSEALVADCLARIAEREPTVQAWRTSTRPRAGAGARTRRGRRPRAAWARCTAVPVAIKDIFFTADMPTGMGSPIHTGNRTLSDASASACCGPPARSSWQDGDHRVRAMHPNQTRNPHNPAHTPGGSSSGTAGVGRRPGWRRPGLGTQTAGSVIRARRRSAASSGWKPSYGVINRTGVMSEAESLDTGSAAWRARWTTSDLRGLGNGRQAGRQQDARPAARASRWRAPPPVARAAAGSRSRRWRTWPAGSPPAGGAGDRG